MGKIVI